jgi:hypothetical protein
MAKNSQLPEYLADETFHRREWCIQRLGWIVLSLVIAVAMAGFLGGGPAAKRTVMVGETAVSIERFVRREAAGEWIVLPGPGTQGALTIRVGAGLMKFIRIDRIEPEPSTQAIVSDGMAFTFDVESPGTPIVFHVEPFEFGMAKGAIQIDDAKPVLITQLIYP